MIEREEFLSIAADVQLGRNVKLAKFINLYGCVVGDNTKIGTFVEIQKNATVGKNCKISSHSFICEGVTIEDNVFIGHGVMFINDSYPRAANEDGELKTERDWKVERTVVSKGASIGSGATILANVTIGKDALIGAGSVVTKDVPANAVAAGNPARVLRYFDSREIVLMSEGMAVPFLDLITPHLELEDELVDAFKDVLRSGAFIGGPVLAEFEKEFAEFCNVKHCVGVSSGTDALRFVLMAAGVGGGEIVLTVPNTFVATIEAILQAGASPQFVDIDESTFNMSAEALREYLETQCDRPDTSGLPVHRGTGRAVRAIIPVHLYGQMCDMDAILEVAEEYGLLVFEDACQAHGSDYFSSKKGCWQRAGSIGKAGAFSFYPGKNLGACGEAGAVTTDDDALAQRIRMVRDHGQNMKYHHVIEGYNGRLDALQAGILRIKLRSLEEWNRQRRQAAETYHALLSVEDWIISPVEPAWSCGVYHLYVIRAQRRDELQRHLTERNIGTGLHYPVPVHLQKGYAHLGYRHGDLPVSEQVAHEILSLPIFPQIQNEQQQVVAQSLLQFYKTQTLV